VWLRFISSSVEHGRRLPVAKFAKSYDIVCLVLSSPDELDEDEGNATGSSPRHLAGCKTKVSF
jgi:hypothetical protein